MADDPDQQIAQLHAEIAALQQAIGTLAALPDAQRPLQAQLAEKQQRLATLQVQSGGVNFGVGNVIGPVGDIVLGDKHEHYSPDPDVAQREQLARYLERLAIACYHLPLRGIEARLDRGESLALPHVYVMLATTDRVEVARDGIEIHPRPVAHFFIEGARDQGLKEDYDPEHALPDSAIIAIEPIAYRDRREQKIDGHALYRAQLAIEAVQRYPRLALLGDPGSGKSTFLRHLAWALARHVLAPDGSSAPRGWDVQRRPLPVFLPLRALAGRLAHDGISDATMFAALRDEIARHQAPADDAATLLDAGLERDGALLLLFDGLDEVPLEAVPGVAADRRSTVRAVRDFLRRHTRAAAVLTCRTRAFDDELRAELGWHVETIAPFTLGQIRAFIPAWFDELTSHGQITSGQARRLGPHLLQAITERTRLRELAGAPLLLTMMALVLYNDGELPRERPQLYERILKLLLGQWDKVREGQSMADAVGQPEWGSERFLPLLDRLSYEAHRDSNSPDGRGRLARGALYTALIDFFRSGRVPMPGEAALRCLDYFEQRSGLLLADSRDSYVFAHLTLQEHCAGRYIALSTENPVGLALEHRADDRWREPLLLSAGLLRPAEVQTLLADLIDREEGGRPKPIERWYRDLILATEIGNDRDWDYLRTLPVVKVDRLQRDLRGGLVALLEDRAQPLPLAERLRAGRALGLLGDPRFPLTLGQWRAEPFPRAFGDPPGYWCYVPAGTYRIGGWQDEGTQAPAPHADLALKPFWIARLPITVAQFRAFVDAGGYGTERWWTKNGWQLRQEQNRIQPWGWDDPQYTGANQPAVGVTWYEAMAYCAWLSEQLKTVLPRGCVLRLPSEAEWETAATYDGSGQQQPYPWGMDGPSPEQAIYDASRLDAPAPVGSCPSGRAVCGALDMAGNVWEWCASSYEAYPEWAQRCEKDFTTDDLSVPLRGGSWYDNSRSVRYGTRRWDYSYGRGGGDGFRLVVAQRAGRTAE
jgi:formylglycine-generating enzyme required for sulfatase activity